MNYPANMYLTDEQYKKLLTKIEAVVTQPDFKPIWFDSTAVGHKFTSSNCGLCNDDFTEEDMALFPDEFPERKSMKYRRDNHKCPFDMRSKPSLLGWGAGCFFKCYLFKNETRDINAMRQMVQSDMQGG